MTRFATWLRVNSQHYLLQDAQARIARKYGITPPPVQGSLFWTKVFVPVYRILPWGLRSKVMGALPGSHRKHWSKQVPPAGSAV